MNIKDIKKGDQVQIANGDWFEVVHEAIENELCVSDDVIILKDLMNPVAVELITDHRPAFNWDDAKSGMCFKYDMGGLVYFVGYDFEDETFVVCADDTECETFFNRSKCGLTRHPEGDIK